MSIDNSWPDVKETIRSTENTARNVEQHIHGLTEKLDASRRLINDLCQSLVRQKVYHDSARDASLSTSDTVFQKYLRDTILSMEERIEQYDQNIEELDRHISAIINATQGEVRPNAITETMRLQHEIFMVVTGKVATIHESVDKLRKEYLEFLRMTGDMSNPFVESDVAGGKDVSLPSYIASHALPESTTQTASGANTTTTGFNMFN
ncbi:9853_t:CDS:2 [Ambispora gerdemannii]|uniref:9853_t:CDS:1 n=1 Tax=Ambispora gerdemannii TaxID=144530 RepID=A0A9N9FXY0_9GLOM|nr:9853_t:CDS:2 [Ambispora gerdemannii]